ncbi:MAG: histone deacetylase [Oscillatoriales cyanobacterium]|nr:MAG: histone deacetylase [Oscillatoriales cyanobacterium]
MSANPSITLIYSDEFLLHDTGWGHPERPDRLRAIVAALQSAPFAERLVWQSPQAVSEQTDPIDSLTAAIERAHDRTYIQQVRELANRGGGQLDMDTPVSPRSYEVARLAVQAWLDGMEQAIATGQQVFVAARPPGHHALRHRGMGFCLFANAAIAAFHALDRPEIQRVAIVDWDVHHGNGTEAIVKDCPEIAYCSIHQMPAYPGTGRPREDDRDRHLLNLPVSPGATAADYRTAVEDSLLPFLRSFGPDLLIVSAGYDANQADPLSQVQLQPTDYGWLTQQLLNLTRSVVFGLEGGYDLESLAASVCETIAAFEPS